MKFAAGDYIRHKSGDDCWLHGRIDSRSAVSYNITFFIPKGENVETLLSSREVDPNWVLDEEYMVDQILTKYGQI